MVVEIILGLVVLGLMVFHIIYVTKTNKQIERLTKAVMARDLADYDRSTQMEKKDTDKEPKVEDDFIPVGDADEDLFDKMLSQQLGIREDE